MNVVSTSAAGNSDGVGGAAAAPGNHTSHRAFVPVVRGRTFKHGKQNIELRTAVLGINSYIPYELGSYYDSYSYNNNIVRLYNYCT